MKQGKIVLQNKKGQVVRSFGWTGGTAAVIFREDTKRLEVSGDLKSLEAHKIPYIQIASISPTKLKRQALDLGLWGSLKWVEKIENFEPAIQLPEEDQETYKKILKFTALGHASVLVLIFLLGSLIYPWLKEEPPTVEVIQQVRVHKPQPKPKTVSMSEKKITPTKNRQANSNRTNKVARTRKTTVKPKTVTKRAPVQREVKVTQVGALGALGGLSKGSRNSAGLNLNSVSNSSGSGLRGIGGRGGYNRALPGKGLVAGAIGAQGRAEGAGGYGTRGKGGGKAGYGQMNMAGSSAAYSQPLDEEALVEGGLDRDQINAVIKRYMGQITYCYEQGLQAQPSLSGRVGVKFVIAANGRVSQAGIANSSLRSSRVESCILGKLRNWQFPKPAGNVNVRVNYPFLLRRISQG